MENQGNTIWCSDYIGTSEKVNFYNVGLKISHEDTQADIQKGDSWFCCEDYLTMKFELWPSVFSPAVEFYLDLWMLDVHTCQLDLWAGALLHFAQHLLGEQGTMFTIGLRQPLKR